VTATPDPLIHPITRLSICGLLAAGADWVEFAALRDAAGISDSVLSKQSRVLEDAGYVEVRKGAVGRRPRTWFRLTAGGRQAVQGHLAWLAQLEETVSAGTRDARQAGHLPGDRDQPASEPEFGELPGKGPALVVTSSGGGRAPRQIHHVDTERVD
jgi:DNA-binding MarR family transcriptional regulator